MTDEIKYEIMYDVVFKRGALIVPNEQLNAMMEEVFDDSNDLHSSMAQLDILYNIFSPERMVEVLNQMHELINKRKFTDVIFNVLRERNIDVDLTSVKSSCGAIWFQDSKNGRNFVVSISEWEN